MPDYDRPRGGGGAATPNAPDNPSLPSALPAQPVAPPESNR